MQALSAVMDAEYKAGDPSAAIAAADALQPMTLPTVERRALYHTDRATAYAQWGRREDCIGALLDAERCAPDETHARPAIKAVINGLLASARTTPELRGLAARVGVLNGWLRSRAWLAFWRRPDVGAAAVPADQRRCDCVDVLEASPPTELLDVGTGVGQPKDLVAESHTPPAVAPRRFHNDRLLLCHAPRISRTSRPRIRATTRLGPEECSSTLHSSCDPRPTAINDQLTHLAGSVRRRIGVLRCTLLAFGDALDDLPHPAEGDTGLCLDRA